jgi:hypothetical protein
LIDARQASAEFVAAKPDSICVPLLSWRYFFAVQVIFASVIFLCLAAAAALARRAQ